MKRRKWGHERFSIRSIEVVNPHSWPVSAKIVKNRLGEREPTQTDALTGEREPTHAYAQSRRAIKREAARTYEIYAFLV